MRAMTIALLLSFVAAMPLAIAADAVLVEPPPATAPTESHPPVAANEPTRIQPSLMTVNAGEGGSYSISDAAPSKLRGGVEIGYEKARIFCDHIDYWQSALAGAKRAALDRAFFINGEHALEPEHVVFDTRKCEVPTIAFRGLMTPTTVEVLRQPIDQDQPEVAHFLVKLHHLGDFAGELQTANGWAPYAGWSDEAELLMVADIVESGLIKPRFENMVFFGRATTASEAKRGALFERLKQPIPPGTAAKMLHSREMDWKLESSKNTFTFDDAGRVKDIVTAQDTHIEGNPSLDMPVHQHGQPAPEAKPKR